MEQYRTPTINEFVPGFKYEVESKHTDGYSILDFSKTPIEILETHMEDYYIWSENTVPNFNEKFYTEKHEDGTQWTWLTTGVFGTEEDLLKSIENLLLKNKIRCKK